jgi:arsenate reductase (glutaredoxin)
VRIKILYNPTCGTCQKVRQSIEAKGHKPEVIEYLKNPPSVDDLDKICKMMGLEPHAIARDKEPIYAQVAARCKTREDWLRALHDHPILIQRPIVIAGDRAIIARPPEKLAELL